MTNWANKVVVVTGGSAGLGQAIALEFARAGAHAVLIARDEQRLRSTAERAQADQLNVDWVVCDVANDQSVDSAVAEIIQRHGRIDVWVNNVGRSTRIKFDACQVSDYQRLMDINFYTAVRCTLAVLDQLTETSGQIVNIGSLSAKTAWPNVAPYTTSKHALAAFNHQLRLEGPSNVNTLFVCPGPVARAGEFDRYDQEAAELGEAAKLPGAGVNLKGIPPDVLAKKIVRYCELRKSELVIPWKTRILFSVAQLSPRLGDFLLRRSLKNRPG